MQIDGRAIAAHIRNEVADRIQASGHTYTLSIIAVAPTGATRSYMAIKQRTAAVVGMSLYEQTLPADIGEEEVVAAVQAAANSSDGVVVQLPLPEHMDMHRVLDAIPHTHDVDVLSSAAREQSAAGTYPILPPVVAAMAEVLARYHIPLAGKKVVVVGSGYLVGAPAATWFSSQGSSVTVIDRDVQEHADVTKRADILISGVGKADLITPDMVGEGVIVLDGGASDVAGSGTPAGDVDPAVAEHSALFTPVPGGIGPIAVACLFRNLVMLSGSGNEHAYTH
jgi:methylenetetrahydrofolate dehydrogenase (NADP+)/methenyltetrahydrofolate cyclohydrolase